MKVIIPPIRLNKIAIISLAIALILVISSILLLQKQEYVDYNADVKPILNKRCISCHGGVKKKGGFSLLFEEEALAPTESGKPAIVPFHADQSEMIMRLKSHDLEERMPYHHEPLSENEISILTKWINQGAKFDLHWAYKPVKNPKLPTRPFFSFNDKKINNEIDLFVDEKLDNVGLKRSEQANKKTLFRRLSLDIIGVPASDTLENQFLNDSTSSAWNNLVDSLLQSEKYGEKWAGMWLDIARYADTKGYERDDARSIWRYRDWLIKSFNQDMPYDEFLTEQLAGDLLPSPTDEQFLATAFHRNTMTNDEGGTDNEEYRTAAVIDRINTTWQTLLGTSFACVQCHSHPYDPFKHEEYYKFMAYFNNTRDEDTYSDYPLLREFNNLSKLQFDSLITWMTTVADAKTFKYYNSLIKTAEPSIHSLVADSMINAALADTKFLAMRKSSWAVFKNISLTDKKRLLLRYRSGAEKGKLNIYLNNKNDKPYLSINISKTTDGWDIMPIEIPEKQGHYNLILQYENSTLKSNDDVGIVFDWLAFTPDFPGKGLKNQSIYHQLFLGLLNKPDATFTPIMMDNPHDMYRKTFVFERGNWLVKTNEVMPDVPSIMKFSNTKISNRLALAKWMTDKRNPLTARTMVNRIWEQLFGQGIVETLEDFGSQGAMPTHKELLDHLSYKFMYEYNWSIKKLISYIVHSATYMQRSVTNDEMKEKDALNKLYARFPRVRLSSEQIRDQALMICGKLSNKMFGPSVMPFQPEGIWASPYDGRKWIQSTGEDFYRRAVYTYWKRTSPYPSMVNFDAGAREVCVARRIRTNTPLQALTTLNDQTYWDLSLQYANQLYPINNINNSIRTAYLRATGNDISVKTLSILIKLYNSSFEKMKSDPCKPEDLNTSKEIKPSKELMSLAIVINSILNLDDVITKN